MVLPTPRWLHAVELLLAVAVCLLVAVSASEPVPAAPEDLGGLPTTQGTEAAPHATSALPRPGGHAVLHALSLCVAVLGATFVLVSRRAPLLAGGRCGPPPAGRATSARCSQTLRLGLSFHAAQAGCVSFAGVQGGYGNLILIDHGGGTVSAYAHQNRLGASKGECVSAGQQIGAVGTGNSTGNHLHFEVRVNGSARNPRPYLP